MSQSFISTLTQEKEDDIIKKYQEGLPTVAIGKLYGFGRKVVARWLKSKGIKMRKNGRGGGLKEDYFEIIDTEEKAYFIGFLLADGCIYSPKNQSLSLNLEIGQKDRYILEKLKSELGMVDKKTCIRILKNTCFIRFNSNKLCSDLEKSGITPRKTFTAKFPNFDQIPKYLFHHFLRGLFDGDGCISVSVRGKIPRKYFAFGICGTLDICLGIENFFAQFLPEETSKKPYLDNNIYTIAYNKLASLKHIYNFLYKDATIFLTRKEEKFRMVFETVMKNNPEGVNSILPIDFPVFKKLRDLDLNQESSC